MKGRERKYALVAIILLLLSGFMCLRQATASSTMALHVSGGTIYNSSNQPFLFKGVGIAGYAPDWYFWPSNGGDSWADQWNYSENAGQEQTAIAQTFSFFENTLKVNLIRVFIQCNTVGSNITPAEMDSSYTGDNTQYNVVDSLQGLAAVASQYGIYIDIVPWGITGYTAGSWTSESASYWTSFWSTLANGLKNCPNIIFEAWNEPYDGSNPNSCTSDYISYVQNMYSTVRSTGATNLIFLQWYYGVCPNSGLTLAWASQLNNALETPTNVAYTTHLYYWAPDDLTPSWDINGVDCNSGGVPQSSSQLETQLQNFESSMGVNAPLVINEEGDCSACSNNLTADYVWWNNLLAAQSTLNLGGCAYYWLSSSGLGGVYDGIDLLDSGYTLNAMGQEYLDMGTANATSTPGSQSSTSTSSHGAVSSITISPAPESITQGTSISFIATAHDAYGNSWDITLLANWSISAGAGGSWSNNNYTSANMGNWTVTASYGGVKSTAQLSVYYVIDFYHTGTVNFNDLEYFIEAYIQYAQTGVLNPACDLNHDGTLNSQDLLLFVADYVAFYTAEYESQAANGA